MASVDPHHRSPAEVFKAEFGNISFTANAESGNGWSCAAGLYGVTCYGGSGEIDHYLIAHELNHTFAQRNGGKPYEDMGNAQERDNNGDWVFGTSDGGAYERTSAGFYSEHMYHGRYWSDWKDNTNNTARNEDFADTGMNWVYHSFDFGGGEGSAGFVRDTWFTTNMVEWLR